MVLNQILKQKKKEIRAAKQEFPLTLLKKGMKRRKKHLLLRALRSGRAPRLICELKKASPSEGLIRSRFDPFQLAKEFERSGACAISVLTEKKYFNGSLDLVPRLKKQVRLPLLRKDFIIDPYQIYEAAYFGADAVLLIAMLLPQNRLKQFIAIANRLGLDALVEIHALPELKRAIKAKAVIVGINNRNLKTLEVDVKRAEKLIPFIPKSVLFIVESGIKHRSQIRSYQKLGADNFLIGTSLMKSRNVCLKIKELLGRSK